MQRINEYEQLCKHFLLLLQSLIQEISGYQATIDKVTEQGQALIMAAQHQTQLVQQIQGQLSNLEDSYMSLHTTADQIKVSLKVMTSGLKFLQYQGHDKQFKSHELRQSQSGISTPKKVKLISAESFFYI